MTLSHEAAGLTVGFAGMTHLGLVSSSVVAWRGFQTICYDADAALAGRLRDGALPVREPELDAIVSGNTGRQIFTSEIGELDACDIVYIAADVPTDDRGNSDLSAIALLIDHVAAALRPDALLVVLCQVPPGFTRAITSVPPERLYYQVETLVFGIAVQRAREPERYIVGCADPEARLDPRFAAFLGAANCPILPMRYESAELAKIAINCCLVASISVANTLAEVCEGVGADWSEIVPALKLDARIGPKAYLAPGLGIAGGNLERDLATVIGLADAQNADAGVVRAWVSNSRHRRGWATREIRKALLETRPDATVAVWGLAYKENTHSTKNSPSLATLAELPGTRFTVHDPAIRSETHRQVAEPLDALEGAAALMILTPWPQYRGFGPADIAGRLAGRLVLDPYRVLDRQAALDAGLDYRTLGVGGDGRKAS
ncbi:UDP binding domain-containing protein [Methylobacterium sp. NEAU 140]|uniref:UDP binding domain-containing protein n=1 Tax=Methylobacterium sp. NEAU 140 TaxID=3064945 RepID=UPI002735B8B1|nr:UDP binding domain-containing protein [Methylobacterium sp. NEAU 140]MDP4025868.1 UDP binding domain-containing protein [Methylobacterium sp. NEAU 140]